MTHRAHKSLFPAPFKAIGALGVLAVMTTGCTGPSGNFPSLSRRAIEAAPNTATVTAPSAPQLDDAALAGFEARIAAAATAAQQSGDDFNTALSRLRATIEAGRGKPKDSDAWLEAEQALSRLEQTRAGAQGAVADLDLIARELTMIGENRRDVVLDSARTAANAIAQAQQSKFSALADMLN
jgi:hypothetical protein